MISYAMTAGEDNAIVWVIEVDTPTPIYLCSGVNIANIALSTGTESRVYSSGLLLNSLSTYPQSIPGSEAGGIGSRSGFSFTIASFGSYSLNDFYPATSGADLIMKNARLGFVWTGATLTSQITWLYEGEIENYESKPEGLFLDITESNFLEYISLPPFIVQKDTDDKVSYYPQAPKDSLGKTIPIVYGEFNKLVLEFGEHRLMPAILVNPSRMIYLGACHKVNSTFYDIETRHAAFVYANGFDSYMELIPSTANTVNTDNGYYVEILPTTRSSSQYVKGRLICWLKAPGEKNDITDLNNLISEDEPDDFILPDKKQIQLLFTGDQTDELGLPGVTESDISFRVYWTTDKDTEQRTIELNIYNPIKAGGAGYGSAVTDSWDDLGSQRVTFYEFGNYTGAKSDTNLPWDLKELLQIGYTIKNVSGATGGSVSGDIVISQVALLIDNISVYNFGQKRASITLGGIFGGILIK